MQTMNLTFKLNNKLIFIIILALNALLFISISLSILQRQSLMADRSNLIHSIAYEAKQIKSIPELSVQINNLQQTCKNIQKIYDSNQLIDLIKAIGEQNNLKITGINQKSSDQNVISATGHIPNQLKYLDKLLTILPALSIYYCDSKTDQMELSFSVPSNLIE